MTMCVLSSCQTRTLVSALRVLLPRARVFGFNVFLAKSAEDRCLIASYAESADVVFSLWLGSEADALCSSSLAAKIGTFVLVPSITFRGFHPDMTYIRTPAGNMSGPLSDYHSAIAAAAYVRGFSVTKTADLFNERMFSELKYFEAYNTSREELLVTFGQHNLNLGDALDRWERMGCFMYTINHPRRIVLCDLARCMCGLAGVRVELELPIEDFVEDYMAFDNVFPVYPQIAARLGFRGGFRFKASQYMPQRRDCAATAAYVWDLEGFISAAFNSYRQYDTRYFRENPAIEATLNSTGLS